MTTSGTTIRNLAVGLLLVVVAFGAYFFLYIQQRERLLAQHHLRLLLNAGSYASDKLEGLLGNVSFAASLSDEEVRRVTSAGSFRGEQQTAMAVEKKLELISDLKEWSGQRLAKQTPEEFLRDSAVVRHISKALDRGQSRDVWIAVALDVLANDVKLVFTAGRPSGPKAVSSVIARQADLRSFLAPTLPGDFFDGVLVARSNGDVLFQEGSSQLRLRRLEPPKPAKDAPAISGLPASQVYDLTLAGERYKFFVQPIPLPIRINHHAGGRKGWELEDYWLVAGFIPAGRYQAMSMAISPTIVLVAVGLIAIGLLALPLLKVRHLGAREELRQVDVLVLAIAIIVSASLTTYAVLLFAVHEESSEATRHGLERFSSEITKQLDLELGRLDDALVALTQQRLAKGAGKFETSILDSRRPVVRPGIRGAGNWSSRTPLVSRRDSLCAYPFLEIALWIDPQGGQKSKWSVRPGTTPLVSLEDRQYFNDARRALLWSADDSSELYSRGRVVESIRSKTTSQEYAMLARRLRRETPDTAVVGAIQSRLLSVMSPVIPPEFGFAIVDRSGLVQFHSDPVRNIRENLFQELGSDLAIRAAVSSGQVVVSKTTYRTVPTVLRVSPVPGTPWSLVVFQDVRAARSWLLEVLTLALFLYSLHLLVFLAAATALFLWLPAKTRPGEVRRLWYWPSREHRHRYASLTLILAGVGLVWAVVVANVSDPGVVGASLGVALAALLLFHVGLRTRWLDPPRPGGRDGAEPRPARPGRMGTHTLHLVMMATAGILIGVLPACGYWRVVYDEEAVLRLKSEQIAFADSLGARRIEKLRWYEKIPLGSAAFEAVERNVRPASSADSAMGFYAPPDWSWRYDPAGTPRPGIGWERSRQTVIEGIRGWLTRNGLPGRSVEPRATCEDSTYRWYSHERTLVCAVVDPAPGGLLGAGAKVPGDGEGFQRLTLSGVPARFDLSRAPLYWILMAVGGLGVMLWLLRVSLRCIFLYHSAPPVAIDGEAALAKGEQPKFALLLRFRLKAPAREACHVIDIREVRGAASVGWIMDRFRRSGKHRALLARFDRGLTEPVIIQRKLDLLDALNAMEPSCEVYIESSVEPLHFLTSRFNDHYEERKDLGIAIERWALALQRYVRLRVKTCVPPQDSREDRRPEGVKTLEAECAPNDMLKRIGDHLRAHASFEERSREQVVDTVLDMAGAHYRRIWTICSTEEKLLLYRIAKEGFANHNAESVLRPLVRRGLVFMDPNCRLMNDSFRKFVLAAERPEALAKWQRRGGASEWSRMKGPILVSVAVLGVFFFGTQREAFNQSLGLVAALAASAPGIISLLGGLSRLGQAGGAKS